MACGRPIGEAQLGPAGGNARYWDPTHRRSAARILFFLVVSLPSVNFGPRDPEPARHVAEARGELGCRGARPRGGAELILLGPPLSP